MPKVKSLINSFNNNSVLDVRPVVLDKEMSSASKHIVENMVGLKSSKNLFYSIIPSKWSIGCIAEMRNDTISVRTQV